jgi:hypothetical protein
VKKKMSGGQTLQNGSREFLKISLKNNLKKKSLLPGSCKQVKSVNISANKINLKTWGRRT